MSSVQAHDGEIIELRRCDCGSDPDYHSANGIAHEIICAACGRQTDMEICGLDAVHEWNAGKVYASADEAPCRRAMRQRLGP
jgi:hypothetical protein